MSPGDPDGAQLDGARVPWARNVAAVMAEALGGPAVKAVPPDEWRVALALAYRAEPEQLLLFAEPGPNAAPVMLTMYPAGKCRLVGTALPCSPYNTEWWVLSRAPDVNGRAAYWLYGTPGLAWQYAPDGWAELEWGSTGKFWPSRGAERTAILRVAASIRYRQNTPRSFISSAPIRPAGPVIRCASRDPRRPPRHTRELFAVACRGWTAGSD